MIYRRFIVNLHISIFTITILSHLIIIKVLLDGLYDESSVLSQLRTRQHVMRKVGWPFIINNWCLTYLIFLKGGHHTNKLFVLFLQQNHIQKNLDQKLRFLPFKSSIYIKGLGAPPSPLADLCGRLAGPAPSLLPYSVDLFCYFWSLYLSFDIWFNSMFSDSTSWTLPTL